MVREKPSGVRPVLSRLGVADRIHDVAVLLEPRGRGSMQLGDGARVGPAQLQPQQVGEELVVAEPRAVGVERDDECVLLLERVEDPLRARGVDEDIGQAPFTRSRMEVLSSSRFTSSGCRSSTSASR